ncbi:hypothetical protein [Brucella intermedia]|uniref:hypothetical protein n=1 Tax=Brucella intermedia TaxID=94625 RepID=UPI00124C40FA|nr:hypothetical protein [Brucella intermedia]KAB2723386.1 hypothetical protein F9L02_22095 [Brucella intermedia]
MIAVDEASLLVTVEDGVRVGRTEVKPASGGGEPLSARKKQRSIRELEPEIPKRRKAGETFAAIASELEIDRETVSNVVRYYEGLANGTLTGPPHQKGRLPVFSQAQLMHWALVEDSLLERLTDPPDAQAVAELRRRIALGR